MDELVDRKSPVSRGSFLKLITSFTGAVSLPSWARLENFSPEKLPEELLIIIENTRRKYPESLLQPVSSTDSLPPDFPRHACEVKLISIQDANLCPSGVIQIAEIISGPLKELIFDAQQQGYDPNIRSGFRDYTEQGLIYNNSLQLLKEKIPGLTQEKAKEIVNQYTARPGFSEHHLGFVVDLLSRQPEINKTTGEAIWDTARKNYKNCLYGWLRENASKFGFVLSYPTGLNPYQAKPGSGYLSAEPWHLRFVGIDLAQYLQKLDYLNPNNSITLHLMLKLIQKIPQPPYTNCQLPLNLPRKSAFNN